MALYKRRVITSRDRYNRIENNVSSGHPDTEQTIDGVDSFIEFKSPDEPARATSKLLKHPFSTDQTNWFLKYVRAGGKNSYAMICTDKQWLLIPGEVIGVQGKKINNWRVIDFKESSIWNAMKPIKKEKWTELRNILSKNQLKQK